MSEDESTQRLARMWSPGWKERFKAAIGARSYSTVEEFLNHHPCRPYDEIVELFGKEFAAVQIIACQFDEARRNRTTLNAIGDVLSRHIVDQFPSGWATGENADYRRASALASWGSDCQVTGQVERFDDLFDCFVERFKPAIGWLPHGPDDPVIMAPLNECWKKVLDR
jgi:hypothetical protein